MSFSISIVFRTPSASHVGMSAMITLIGSAPVQPLPRIAQLSNPRFFQTMHRQVQIGRNYGADPPLHVQSIESFE